MMKLKSKLQGVALSLAAILFTLAPIPVEAQEPAPPQQEPASRWPRLWLKDGKLSFSARYRLEAFERDGAPFTATAYAPTLRLALGYETPSFHGFTVLAQAKR